MTDKTEYPYVFQSGKYKQLPLESVFLIDPTHLSRFYRQMYSRVKSLRPPNLAQLAMDNLFGKLKNLPVTTICPICQKENVEHFLMPDYGVVSEKLICCDQIDCKKSLKAVRAGQLHKIHKFLPLLCHVKKNEAKKIITIFQKTHENYEEAFA